MCDKSYASRKRIRDHKKKKHGLRTNSVTLEKYVPFFQFDGEIKAREVKLTKLNDLLMERIEIENGVSKCKVCGKMSKNTSHAKEHAEIHMEGLIYECTECRKCFHTSLTLRKHEKRIHGKQNKSLDL